MLYAKPAIRIAFVRAFQMNMMLPFVAVHPVMLPEQQDVVRLFSDFHLQDGIPDEVLGQINKHFLYDLDWIYGGENGIRTRILSDRFLGAACMPIPPSRL